MKIFRNKKAMVLILLLSIFSLFFIMPSLYTKIVSNRAVFSAKIGETQFKILDTIQSNQEKLFYIDQAAKYSSFLALAELEEKGIYLKEPICGKINGYSLWQSKEKTCFPGKDDIILNFQTAIKPYLDDFLRKNNLPEENYEFFIKIEDDKFRLVGTALKNLISDIKFKDEIIGKYSIKPSFDIFINYDLSFYDELKNTFLGSGAIMSEMSACDSQRLESCINEIFDNFNQENRIQLEIDCDNKDNSDDRTFFICATDKEKEYLLPDSGSGFITVSQKVKFAIYIVDLPSSRIEEIIPISPSGEDKYLILKWKRAKGSDIDHFFEEKTIYPYNIYISDEDFSGKTITEHEIENTEKLILPETITKIENFEAESCKYKQIGKNCLHNLDSGQKSLSELNNQLICDDEYCYYITDKDFKSYIYITAIDKANNEITEAGKAIKITKEDKLALGKVDFTATAQAENLITININSIGSNIDNSEFSNDIQKYYIFAADNEEDIVQFANLKAETDDSSISIITSQNPFIGIIAIDSSGNPLKKISATGEEEGRLEINDEYKDIIHQLSNPKKSTFP
ncbi:MAG: hypothetical protein KAK00_07345 [Nanoarchaeota archaeon]|nr:hypothetical protein [Nanoarchaeota archaeon]